MHSRRYSALARTLSGVLAAVLATSCSLTPSPETPEIVQGIEALPTFDGASERSTDESSRLGWWAAVGGDELGEYVDVLRKDSLVLAEARLQALQSRELTRQARSARLPSASASVDATSTRVPGPNENGIYTEDYTGSLAASFDTDVFGGLRASERAAQLNALAAELTYRATEQREIATLAKNWVSAATLQRRLDLANSIAESFRATYELTDQRYRAGSSSSSASDVQIALQNYDTARVDIPDLATQLATQLLAIDEQLVRLPGQTAAAFQGQFQPEYNAAALLGQPASLLANRPDVAAAELRYRAALEDVGAARANLYPALSLTAALTFQSETPSDLFDWGEHIGSLASALVQPVFQGGRLRSQVRLDQARAEELAAAFARTTLGAVIDVEIALANLAGLDEQRERLIAAVTSARISDDIAQSRYRQGLTSILAVLETQRGLNTAQQNLILIEQALLNAQIDLFLGLGGVWIN
ncbi:MAG: efflux transporter outer membrane subunit [Pseudomonadota bacterium]